MNLVWIAVALAVGVALGAFHFLGLWLTVRGVVAKRLSAWWLPVSFVLRVAVVLIGFYLIIGGRWERLVACVAGFVLARTWIASRFERAMKTEN